MVSVSSVINNVIALEPTLAAIITIIAAYREISDLISSSDDIDEISEYTPIDCPLGDRDNLRGVRGLAAHWWQIHPDVEQ